MAEVKIMQGDSRDLLKELADNSIDSVVTDPPYALVSITKRFGGANAKPPKGDVYQRAVSGFMNATWDTGETAFAVEFWAEVMRVLKPGGHVVAFSGTRTYHRLACAIEDAGFEMRDMLQWLYGSGFPKSHNVAKVTGLIEHEGLGTALKPACEPIVLARKALSSTVAANVVEYGTGALSIDTCRIGYDHSDTNPATNPLHRKVGGYANGNASDARSTSFALKDGSGERNPNTLGRWPANVVHDGSDEVLGMFPDSNGQQGDVRGTEPSSLTNAVYGQFGGRPATTARGDSGSAARFFYTAKADATDRLGSKHPTVNPTDLMRWLCRLVTPPGGLILDPFAGSGSTGVAAIAEGFDAVLIEREEQYVADIRRRIAWAQGEGRLTAQEMAKVADASIDDLPLFSSPDVEAA